MGFSVFDAQRIISDKEDADDTYVANTVLIVWMSNTRATGLLSALCRNTDTIAHIVSVHLVYAVTTSQGIIFDVSVPAGAGVGTVPPFEILAVLPIAPISFPTFQPTYGPGYSLPVPPSAGTVVSIHSTLAEF